MIFPWTSTRRRTNSSIKDWEKFPPSSAIGSQVLGGKVEGGATGAGDEDEERKRRLWVVADEETGKLPRMQPDAWNQLVGVGPPVSGSPRLPRLLWGEGDRWSPKRSAPVSALLPPPPVLRRRARETRRPWLASALHNCRGQLLTERAWPAASSSHKNVTAPLWM